MKHIRAVIAGVEGTVLGLSVLTLSNERGTLYPPHYYMPPPPKIFRPCDGPAYLREVTFGIPKVLKCDKNFTLLLDLVTREMSA